MRASSILATLALTALLFTACTLQPRFERPPLPVAATYPAADKAGTMKKPPAAKATALPAAGIGWRDFFPDARLQQLIERALHNNRDMRIAALKLEQVRAQYQIRRTALTPHFALKGGLNQSRTPADLSFIQRALVSSQYEAGFTAAWEIDFFGKLRSLKDAALSAYFSTAQARRAAEIGLIAQLANQYLTTRAFAAQSEMAKATLAAALESLQLVKARFEAGTVAELDLRAAESLAEQRRAELDDARRLRAQAENALVLLVGEPLPADLPPPLALADQKLLADIPPGLPSDLLTRRPDIIAAEEDLRAANANIGAARAAFFPSISLTGQFGSASSALSGLFKTGSTLWRFIPQLAAPLFSGGADLDIAHVRKNIAVALYEKAIQTAFREVADGLAARRAYETQIAALERHAAAQKRRLKLTALRYRQGVDNYARFLNAQTALYSARQALVTARLARLMNLVHLYQALGGGRLERTGAPARPADAADLDARAVGFG